MRRILADALQWCRSALTENIGLKVLALVCAVGLFAYLHGQEKVYARTLTVAVVMRLPSDRANRELMTPIPANIHVTVRGPARALEPLIQTGVPPVELDLRDGTQDLVTFETGMFSLPPGVEVTIIDPPSIALEWQNVVTRRIPLQASMTGKPADGFEVKGEPEVEPKHVMVRGPQSLVEVTQFIRLAAFDVSGLGEGVYRRPIAIDAPPSRLYYVDLNSTTVTVTVTRRESEMKFERTVEVIGAGKQLATVPRTVIITVVGSPEVVRALRPEQVVPRADLRAAGIDFGQQPHGSAAVKLTVDLADAKTHVQPPSVTVKW
ncbi:YbbR-like domain-containing protein [Myxococcota bacterium]